MASGVNFGTQQYFGFDPRTVPGCVLWLDAADASTLVLSGSSVTQWNDKSGNGRNATQSTPSQQPTYANNTVSFNKANNTVLALPNDTIPSGNSAYSIYMVHTPQSGGVDVILFSGNAVTNQANGVYYASGGYQNYWFNVDIAGGVATTGTRTIMEFLYDQNVNRYIYQNGNLQTTLASSNRAGGTGNNYIGAEVLRGFYSTVDMHEIIIYNTSSSLLARQQIEGYLSTKWGLTANLPNGHPYKTIRPLMRLFQPTDVLRCSLWLDAADGSTVSTPVTSAITQWRDKSGNGNNTTSIGSATYASNVAAFNNLNCVSNVTNLTGPITASGTTELTMIVVGSVPALSGTYWNALALNSSVKATAVANFYAAGNAFFSYYGGNPNVYGFSAGNMSLSTPITYGQPFLWIGQVSGATTNTWGSGTFYGSSTVTSATYTYSGYWVGGPDPVPAWPGNIGEIIVYGSNISTADRQRLEGYLAWKWGLRGNLPTTHPYYKLPPATPIFVPTQLSTCILWLDFNDLTKIVYSGTSISQVTDKSSGARVFTPVGGVLLDSAQITGMTTCSLPLSRLTTSSFPWSTRFTAFFLIKSGGNFLFSQQDASGDPYGAYRNFIWFGNNPMAYINAVFSGSDSVAGVNPTIANNWAIVELAYANSTTLSSLRVNGTARSVTTGTATALATITTNLWINGNRNYFQGYDTTCFIGEILMYSDSLSTSDITAVEGYLAWKWKLQNLLPTTHPYKKFRP